MKFSNNNVVSCNNIIVIMINNVVIKKRLQYDNKKLMKIRSEIDVKRLNAEKL